MDNRNISILLLAAGNSSRLGRSKQLLRLANGKYLLEATINKAIASKSNDLFVVLGANYSIHVPIVQKYAQVEVINHTEWHKGIGSSIKAGVQRILAVRPEVEGILIMVADQVFLETAVIDQLINCSNETQAGIVACEYSSKEFGVPVLFKRNYFDKLLTIPDDRGALQLVRKNLANCSMITFEKGDIDIDTEEDVNQYIGRVP